jgi:hypothetical protein
VVVREALVQEPFQVAQTRVLEICCSFLNLRASSATGQFFHSAVEEVLLCAPVQTLDLTRPVEINIIDTFSLWYLVNKPL